MNFKQYDEYGWERELRKDDARVHAYMKELPDYLDLPDEDELMLKRMQHYPELIPQNNEWPEGPYASIFEDFDDEEDSGPSGDWRERPGADIYIQLRKLAMQWCVVFSASLTKEAMPSGLRILSVYGKIIARLSDVIDLDDKDFTTLKLALCKRLGSELNYLIGEFAVMAKKWPNTKSHINTQTSHLQDIREKLIDIIYSLRNAS